MLKISTSILSTNDRKQTIQKLNNTNTDYIHIDTMDGIFVNNYQMPPKEIITLNKISHKPFDIHLMVENPQDYLEKIQNLNIEYVTIHLEIKHDIYQIINLIKKSGYKVGLSIKPNTPVTSLLPYLDKIDLVLIMSVEPGRGGQEFIPTSLDKAKEIRAHNQQVIIEMDGGIKQHNINNIKQYIDIAVIGSYITNQENFQEAINSLKN